MTSCYPYYDMSLSSSLLIPQHQSHYNSKMQQSSRSASFLMVHQQQSQQSSQTQQPTQKDYSIPLHVDCSVEYELPNQAKPPVGARIEPLLMIHPCYFRKIESQRRSPFINNMPNSLMHCANLSNYQKVVITSTTCSNSTTHISGRRSNVLATNKSLAIASSSTQNNKDIQSMSNQNAAATIQQKQKIQVQPIITNHLQAMPQNHNQNLQAQIDEYVQRQMVHISQQSQYPTGQLHYHESNHVKQYVASTSHQNQQIETNSNWDNFRNLSTTSMSGKDILPTQNAQKKSRKRQSSATCVNVSSGHLDGESSDGHVRFDEKTCVTRDYKFDHEFLLTSSSQRHPQLQQVSANSKILNGSQYESHGLSNQQPMLISGNLRDRDHMSMGGCMYRNNMISNDNLMRNSVSSELREPVYKTPLTAIPNINYRPGSDSIPINNDIVRTLNNKTRSNSVMTPFHQPSTSSAVQQFHFSTQQQQPVPYIMDQSDKLRSQNSKNNNNFITVKYRQYRNAHRTHPYMMSKVAASSVNADISSYFQQLNAPFPYIQQVSCYNI